MRSTPKPQTLDETNDIDHNHPVWEWISYHGFGLDQLVDPGHLTPEMVDSGDLDNLTLIRVTATNGIVEYPISPIDLTNDSQLKEYPYAVEFGHSAIQPIDIGYAVNRNLPAADKLSSSDHIVAVFGFGDRKYPDMAERDVVTALEKMRYKSMVRPETLDHWASVLGFENPVDVFNEDDIGEWAYAEYVPSNFVANIDELEIQQTDDGISGHKRMARQRYTRNLEQLQAYVNGDTNE